MLSRAACLIVIPGMLYLLQFYILFAVARKTGPHDDMMSSAFQASLEVQLKYTSDHSVQFNNYNAPNMLPCC